MLPTSGKDIQFKETKAIPCQYFMTKNIKHIANE